MNCEWTIHLVGYPGAVATKPDEPSCRSSRSATMAVSDVDVTTAHTPSQRGRSPGRAMADGGVEPTVAG